MLNRSVEVIEAAVRGSVSIGQRFPRLVVTCWVLVAVVLTIFVTPLSSVVERSSTAFLPTNSATLSGLRIMDEAFGNGRTSSFVFVVFESTHRLNADDRALYEALVTRLKHDSSRVSEVESGLDTKESQGAFTSKDGKATYIAVGIPGAVGSPLADGDVAWIRGLVSDIGVPAGTHVYVTGDPAMISDLTTAVNAASQRVTAITIVLLLVILWLVYRRWITVLVPLVTIGIALVCARGILAFLGEHGVALSTYTDAFVIAITLGAGTDYCVFLISRFREEYANGHTPQRALTIATQRIGPALLASAATVILGAISLSFANLAIFATTGPAMAICVIVTVAVSLTLTPGLLHWLGPHIGPASPVKQQSRWRQLALLLTQQPAKVLMACTAVLVALAALTPTMRLTFDERTGQPANTPSNLGLAALNRHFPTNQTLPDYLLITSSHDLRNSQDLAVLNAVSIAISKVSQVEQVRSITQPTGSPLQPASIAYQLRSVASNLAGANQQLAKAGPGIQKLANGTGTLPSALAQIASGTDKAAGATGRLAGGSTALSGGLEKAVVGVNAATSGSTQLQAGAQRLADALTTTTSRVAASVNGLEQIVQALQSDVLCGLDPVCARARMGLATIANGQRDQLLPGLSQAAQGAHSLQNGNATLSAALNQIAGGLQAAEMGSRHLSAAQEQLSAKMRILAQGTGQLSSITSDIAPGIAHLLAQTRSLQHGLDQTTTYLKQVNAGANTPTSSGFYLPPRALSAPSFVQALKAYISPDGRTTRIEVMGTTDPLTPSGQARYAAIQQAARQALNKTPLANATLLATGAGGLGADLKHYLFTDAELVVIVVLLVVLMILILALRALIAPIYLLASVALSCSSALGLTTLVFQYLLGQSISFTVPVMVFVLLVSVGADYNILLMSRIREGEGRTTREVVSEAVIRTGPVITAAGVIFASTFIALLTSPISALAQIGFGVAAGLLLDTFVVRSMVVPACAALLEDRNWWPTARRGRTNQLRATTPKPQGPTTNQFLQLWEADPREREFLSSRQRY